MVLGLKSVEVMEFEEGKVIVQDVDFLMLVLEDDLLVYVRNKMEGGLINLFDMNQVQYYFYYVMVLKEVFDVIDYELQVYVLGLEVVFLEDEQLFLLVYFIKYLKQKLVFVFIVEVMLVLFREILIVFCYLLQILCYYFIYLFIECLIIFFCKMYIGGYLEFFQMG